MLNNPNPIFYLNSWLRTMLRVRFISDFTSALHILRLISTNHCRLLQCHQMNCMHIHAILSMWPYVCNWIVQRSMFICNKHSNVITQYKIAVNSTTLCVLQTVLSKETFRNYQHTKLMVYLFCFLHFTGIPWFSLKS